MRSTKTLGIVADSRTTMREFPLLFCRKEGCIVEDVDINEVDLLCGGYVE